MIPVLLFPQFDPVIIQIGPFGIRWYALAYIAGLVLGWRLLRVGTVLAWIGVVLAATGLVVAAIVGLVHLATSPGGHDYAPTVN